jgi:ADP-ribose pyrophosphatase
MNDEHATVIDSRTIYSGRIISVTLDRVRLPHGPEANLEIVRHRGSVVLLPMVDETTVVLVRQYRYAVDRWLWELPAGSLEPNEDPETAAARECEEEIQMIPRSVVRVGRFFPTPGFCNEEMLFFRLTGLEKPGPGVKPAERDEDEHLDVAAFGVAEVREMIGRGEIQDLKTAVGLTLIG